jgi:hypothetical protein
MANPVRSQSQPAPSIFRSSFAIRCVPKVTTPVSKALITISREFWGDRIMRVFIVCAIVVRAAVGLGFHYAETTPQQSLQAWMIEQPS